MGIVNDICSGVFPINYLGAKPRFFDLDSDSWCININILADELKNASAKKRLPRQSFQIYGQAVDIDQLENLAKYSIPLIIDSAESFGAESSKGRKAGRR